MAEEHEHKHGLAHGHHGEGDHKDKDRATYWALGLSAVGVLLAVLVLSGGKKSKPGTNTVVQESRPFIPNPSDVSIGSMAAPLYWPALPTSGTPHHPKVHHTGDSDHDNDAAEKSKKKHGHSHTKPNDHKGYGTSPTGASHGHTVTVHSHNPVTVKQHTKGHSNG